MSSNNLVPSKSSGPVLIGAGLMRTGTKSQMEAFQILLGGRCYHMEVLMGQRPRHLRLWYKAATEGMTAELAHQLLDGFVATTDFPTAHFYKELSVIYPNATFVLSVREPERWVASVRATIQKGVEVADMMFLPMQWTMGITYFKPVLDEVLGTRLGFRFDMSDAEMARVFEKHTEDVIRTIPKERLLVFRVSDGWEPLCKFLDLPVPDVPFPNINVTKQFQAGIAAFRVTVAVYNAAFCAAIGAGLWFGARYCLKKWF